MLKAYQHKHIYLSVYLSYLQERKFVHMAELEGGKWDDRLPYWMHEIVMINANMKVVIEQIDKIIVDMERLEALTNE